MEVNIKSFTVNLQRYYVIKKEGSVLLRAEDLKSGESFRKEFDETKIKLSIGREMTVDMFFQALCIGFQNKFITTQNHTLVCSEEININGSKVYVEFIAELEEEPPGIEKCNRQVVNLSSRVFDVEKLIQKMIGLMEDYKKAQESIDKTIAQQASENQHNFQKIGKDVLEIAQSLTLVSKVQDEHLSKYQPQTENVLTRLSYLENSHESMGQSFDSRLNDEVKKVEQKFQEDLNLVSIKSAQDITQINARMIQEINDLDKTMSKVIGDLDTKTNKIINELDSRANKLINDLDSKISKELVGIDAKISKEMMAIESKISKEIGSIDSKISKEISVMDSKIVKESSKIKEDKDMAEKSMINKSTKQITEIENRLIDFNLRSSKEMDMLKDKLENFEKTSLDQYAYTQGYLDKSEREFISISKKLTELDRNFKRQLTLFPPINSPAKESPNRSFDMKKSVEETPQSTKAESMRESHLNELIERQKSLIEKNESKFSELNKRIIVLENASRKVDDLKKSFEKSEHANTLTFSEVIRKLNELEKSAKKLDEIESAVHLHEKLIHSPPEQEGNPMPKIHNHRILSPMRISAPNDEMEFPEFQRKLGGEKVMRVSDLKEKKSGLPPRTPDRLRESDDPEDGEIEKTGRLAFNTSSPNKIYFAYGNGNRTVKYTNTKNEWCCLMGQDPLSDQGRIKFSFIVENTKSGNLEIGLAPNVYLNQEKYFCVGCVYYCAGSSKVYGGDRNITLDLPKIRNGDRITVAMNQKEGTVAIFLNGIKKWAGTVNQNFIYYPCVAFWDIGDCVTIST